MTRTRQQLDVINDALDAAEWIGLETMVECFEEARASAAHDWLERLYWSAIGVADAASRLDRLDIHQAAHIAARKIQDAQAVLRRRAA